MALPPEDALPRVLAMYGPSFATAVTAMSADPRAGVMFHCRLGKDRTGVFAALLLKLLRVSDADVIEDYMLTAQVEPQMKRLLASIEEAAEAREPRVAREPVDRRAIECVLERLESQYGTAYNYFLRHGVAAEHLNALIESLLEPASAGPDATRRADVPVAALIPN
jgi:protein-tyrosine phosphatase